MRKSLSCILLAIAFAVALPALAAPNFTGTWKLDKSKSEFGQSPAPAGMTWKISHNDPQLKITFLVSTDKGELTSESNFTTDGKDCFNQVGGGQLKSNLNWDGDTLLLDSQAKDFVENEKLWLSDGGKTLNLTRVVKNDKQKFVFAKQ